MIYGIVFIEYLRYIYQKGQENSRIRRVDISKGFGVSRPTAGHKLKAMEDDGYILIQDNTITLTKQGLRLCDKINKAIDLVKGNLRKGFLVSEEILTDWAVAILGSQDFESTYALLLEK